MRALPVFLFSATVLFSGFGFAQVKDLAEIYKTVRKALCTIVEVSKPGSSCPLPDELIYPLADEDVRGIIQDSERWVVLMWKVRYMDKPLSFLVEEIQRRGTKEELRRRKGRNDLRVYLVDTDPKITDIADAIGSSSFTYQGDIRALVLPPAVEETFLTDIPLLVTERDLAVGVPFTDRRGRGQMTWWTVDGNALSYFKQVVIQAIGYVIEGASQQEEAERARRETP